MLPCQTLTNIRAVRVSYVSLISENAAQSRRIDDLFNSANAQSAVAVLPWKKSITNDGFTPYSATCRLRSSKHKDVPCPPNLSSWLRIGVTSNERTCPAASMPTDLKEGSHH